GAHGAAPSDDVPAAALLLPVPLVPPARVGAAPTGRAACHRGGRQARERRVAPQSVPADAAPPASLLARLRDARAHPPVHRGVTVPEGVRLVRVVTPGLRGPHRARAGRSGVRRLLPARVLPERSVLPHAPVPGLGLAQRW